MDPSRSLIAASCLLALASPAIAEEPTATGTVIIQTKVTGASDVTVTLTSSASSQPAGAASTQPATQPTSQPTTQPVEALGPATRVTLSLKNASPKDAFAALEKASKIKVTSPGNMLDQAAGSVTYDAKDEPWLAALFELCTQASLYPQYIPSTGWMVMNGGDRRINGRRSVRGPTMTICHSVSTDSDIVYGLENNKETRVSLGCMFVAEPAVPVIGIDPMAVVDEVLDGNGKAVTWNTVAAQQFGARQMRVAGGAFSLRRDISVGFTITGEPPAKLSVVRGKLFLNLLDQTIDLKVKDLLGAEGKSFDVQGNTFKITRVAFENGAYMVDIAMPRSGEVNQGQYNQPPFAPRLDGRQPHEVRVQQFQQRDGQTIITLFVRPQINNANENDKPSVDLTWSLPGTFKKVEVPFEFKDLTLPK